MTAPTKEEINRGIAEYMGKEDNYTESLDSLVPVLEKLGKDFDCYMHRDKNGDINGWLLYFQGCKIEASGDTLQMAAALATYNAIKEIEG